MFLPKDSAKNKVDLTTDLRAFSRPFELHLILFDVIRKDSIWSKNCSRMFFRAKRKFLNILDSQFTRTKQIIQQKHRKMEKSKLLK